LITLKKIKGVLLFIIISCAIISFQACIFKKSTKIDQIDECDSKILSFKEAMGILDKMSISMDSFKGKVKINFKDKKEGKEKVFNCAVIYKKSEFIRLDAYTSIGANYFKLFAKSKFFDIYIPLKNILLSANLDDLQFLQNKKWHTILPLVSLDLCNLVGIPYGAKPLFMNREIVSRDLFYYFESGNYGILSFDREDEKVDKNEQFDKNGFKIAQIQYKDYKRMGNLLYPNIISISDYQSDTYIKIEFEEFEPLCLSDPEKDFTLKYPDDVKKESIEKIQGKLQRWFIIEDQEPEQQPAN
jgi:hypothetical protein